MSKYGILPISAAPVVDQALLFELVDSPNAAGVLNAIAGTAVVVNKALEARRDATAAMSLALRTFKDMCTASELLGSLDRAVKPSLYVNAAAYEAVAVEVKAVLEFIDGLAAAVHETSANAVRLEEKADELIRLAIAANDETLAAIASADGYPASRKLADGMLAGFVFVAVMCAMSAASIRFAGGLPEISFNVVADRVVSWFVPVLVFIMFNISKQTTPGFLITLMVFLVCVGISRL